MGPSWDVLIHFLKLTILSQYTALIIEYAQHLAKPLNTRKFSLS